MNTINFWVLLTLIIVIIGTGILLTAQQPKSFDVEVILWFRDSQDLTRMAGPDFMLPFWKFISYLGNTAPRVIVALLTLALLWYFKQKEQTLFVAAILLSGIIFSTLIKLWVARSRPELVNYLDHFSSHSFPSGHAFNSTLYYFAFVWLVLPVLPISIPSWVIYSLATFLSIATGLSRIALGIHWPTDVLASWCLAILWLFIWIQLARSYWPKIVVSF